MSRLFGAVILELVLAGFFLTTSPASADSFNYPQGQFRDLQQTLQARKALFDDERLGVLNLGVKIENRVAYLWGPVPTPTLMSQAIDTVRQVPGVLRVHHDLHLEIQKDEGIQVAMPESVFPVNPPVEVFSSPVESLSSPVEQSPWVSAKPKPLPETPGKLMKQPEKPLTGHLIPEQNLTFKPAVVEPQKVEGDGLFVLPVAIALPPQSNSGLSIAQRIPVNNLEVRINQLKASQARFSRFQVQIVNGYVYLRGEAYRLQDAHDFAQVISQIPSVEQVIIGQIRPVPRGS